MIARLLYVALCLAGFAAFYFAMRWGVYGVNRDFGIGFGVGVAFMSLIAGAYLTLRHGE